MGYILVQILGKNGKALNSTPRKIKANLELVAALRVVAYISEFISIRGLKKEDIEAIITLVNMDDSGVFSSLVKKYSPVPVTIRRVREEVVGEEKL